MDNPPRDTRTRSVGVIQMKPIWPICDMACFRWEVRNPSAVVVTCRRRRERGGATGDGHTRASASDKGVTLLLVY